MFSLIYVSAIALLGDYIKTTDMTFFPSLTMGAGVVIVIRLLSDIHRDLFGNKLYLRAQLRLFQRLNKNLSYLNKKLSNAQLLHRITTDYSLLSDALSQGLLLFFSQAVIGAIGILYVAFKFPQELVQISLFALLGIGISWILRSRLKIIGHKKQECEDSIFRRQKNFVEGYEYLKTSDRLIEEETKVTQEYNHWFNIEKKAAYLQHLSGTLNWGVRYLFIVLIVSPIVIQQDLAPELVYWIYVLLGVLSQLFWSVYHLGQIQVHGERSLELIEEKEVIEHRVFNAEKKYEAKDLRLCFPPFQDLTSKEEQPGISNFSFCWRIGERIWLQGASGAGKTTLLRSLLGLHQNFSGHLSVPEDIVQIGYLPQRPFFFSGEKLSVNLGLDINVKKLGKEELALAKQLQILDLLEHLDSIVGSEGFAPSEGQRVRIGLFRELIKFPEILILDEPTASLDKESADSVMKVINHFSENRMIIVCAHDAGLQKVYQPTIKLTIGEGRVVSELV